MKIVSWNIRKISYNKLSNKFSTTFSSYGLGNEVISYILNLVMGGEEWSNIANLSTKPADIFVIVELVTGGTSKGGSVNGNCLNTLQVLRSAMNALAKRKYQDNSKYDYDIVAPLVTGYHETVGIIFNKKALKLEAREILRDNTTNQYMLPKTPIAAQFKDLNTGGSFIVVAVHAPPTSTKTGTQHYAPPIKYCNRLQNLKVASWNDVLYMGDFNCNPNASYYAFSKGMNQKVTPFAGLFKLGYKTFLPNGTLSSVRKTLNTQNSGQEQYLNDAYDNIIFNVGALNNSNTSEIVVDMIGNTRNMNASGTPIVFGKNSKTSQAILSAFFNRVSDHLPVVIEW